VNISVGQGGTNILITKGRDSRSALYCTEMEKRGLIIDDTGLVLSDQLERQAGGVGGVVADWTGRDCPAQTQRFDI
jgi:hypothetical protein